MFKPQEHNMDFFMKAKVESKLRMRFWMIWSNVSVKLVSLPSKHVL